MKSINPPRFAERLFHWFCSENHVEGLEGDLYELFEKRAEKYGLFKAKIYYIVDVLTLIRRTVVKPIPRFKNNFTMSIIKNYLKTSIRMGWKRKGFSSINLFGLTIGILSVLLITLFVMDELSYDQYITNAENKYRVYNIRYGNDGEINHLPIVPPTFAPTLKDNFPQVVKTGRIIYDYGGTVFNIDDKAFKEKNGFYAEIPALEILDIQLLEGDLNKLKEPESLLLSQSLFRKFFGDVAFNNQTLKLTRTTLQVAGIFKDFPEHSHLEVDYIFSFKMIERLIPEERMQNWVWQQFFTYLQLREDADPDKFLTEARTLIKERSRKQTNAYGFHYITHLQNIRDIHLHSSNFEWDIAKIGNYQSILFLSVAAIIILIIAGLNFINLTTAQAIQRAREVSVRKFIGATRSQLLLQYIMETSLYTLTSGIIAIILLILLIPYFNEFTGKTLELVEIFKVNYILIYAGGLILLGILSGIYPAFIISSFKTLTAAGGASNLNIGMNRLSGKLNIRQIMVGIQYILSVGLIILSIIIQKQYNFLGQKDMGFKKENLIVIPLTNSLEDNLNLTRQQFADHHNVKNITFSYGVPGGIVAGDGIFLPEKADNEFASNMFLIDLNYISTMGMDIIAGRDFSPERPTDSSEAFIINETAVRNFGLGSPEEAIGEPVHWSIWSQRDDGDSLKRGQIIGVVGDFNFKSLHNEVSSVVMHIGPEYFNSMIIRVGSEDLPGTISHIEKQYRSFEPKRPFEYSFVDETFQEFYETEQKLTQLFSLFTVLAIVTASIGLFALVTFSVISRTKEISIRKVFGAGAGSIFGLLVGKYFMLALISMFIAFPLSYYMATEWLNNFAYRIDINLWVFFQVIIITILITLFTVGYQALKGVRANPADRLRSE